MKHLLYCIKVTFTLYYLFDLGLGRYDDPVEKCIPVFFFLYFLFFFVSLKMCYSLGIVITVDGQNLRN